MARVILHIDLDAFFASVEIAKNPNLKGKPLIVGGKFNRGVVSAASYEARKYGIRAGMPVMQAIKLCPNLLNKEVDMVSYKTYSNLFFDVIKEKCGDKIEIASIDECFVDFSEKSKIIPSVNKYLKDLQKHIKKELNLTCSIGVAPNKFLAKMASDMEKPSGLTILRKREITKLLWPLDIGKMYGIGKKTAPKLKEIGINTIGDLANSFDNLEARQILGKSFFTMVERANGNDKSEVIDYEVDAKSIGNSRTFSVDITHLDEAKNKLLEIAKLVSRRILNISSMAFGISIVIKYNDFSVVNRSSKLDRPICNEEEIYLKALKLFEDNYIVNKPIRLLGITLYDISEKSLVLKQLNIYDVEISKDSTNDIINKLNNLLGKKVFKKASEVDNKND